MQVWCPSGEQCILLMVVWCVALHMPKPTQIAGGRIRNQQWGITRWVTSSDKSNQSLGNSDIFQYFVLFPKLGTLLLKVLILWVMYLFSTFSPNRELDILMSELAYKHSGKQVGRGEMGRCPIQSRNIFCESSFISSFMHEMFMISHTHSLSIQAYYPETLALQTSQLPKCARKININSESREPSLHSPKINLIGNNHMCCDCIGDTQRNKTCLFHPLDFPFPVNNQWLLTHSDFLLKSWAESKWSQ